MKAAVLGLGSIGMRHARNLRLLGVGEIVGMDPDEARRREFSEELNGPAVDTLDAVLAEMPGLAVIASPNRFHLEQALACARAECHLLIEKPLGTSDAGIDELLQLIESHGLFAHLGSNWKFHPAFRMIKSFLDNGTIGQLTGIQVLAGQWLPDWHPREDYRTMYAARKDLGGGVIFDTHEIDIMIWLAGPIRQTAGFARRSGALEIETDDLLGAAFVFENGAIGTLHTDYIQREPRRRYHLSGDRGTIEWEFGKDVVRVYEAETATEVRHQAPLHDPNDMYIAQLQHIIDGINRSEAPMTPISQGAHVLDIQLELSRRSVS